MRPLRQCGLCCTVFLTGRRVFSGQKEERGTDGKFSSLFKEIFLDEPTGVEILSIFRKLRRTFYAETDT